MISSAINYVNMEEIEPQEGSLKTLLKMVFQTKIKEGHQTITSIPLDEYRVKLEDNRFDFMGLSPSKELSFLNSNDNFTELSYNPYGNTGFYIYLSNRVIIQKRNVYTVLMMFGDVGGLSDFLALGLSFFFTIFEEPMMLASIAEKLFLFTPHSTDKVPKLTNSRENARHQISKAIKSVQRIKFSTCFLLLNVITLGLIPQDDAKRRQALKVG